MSYSYLQNVFPKFESSILDKKIYNNLDNESNNTINTPINQKVPLAYDENEFSKFAKDLLNKKTDNYQISQTKLPIIEEYTNTNTTTDIPNITLPQNTPTIDVNCKTNMNHIINCNKCKNMIIKQMSLDNERLRNEEIMELFSYIIFGIFILLLLDIIKKN